MIDKLLIDRTKAILHEIALHIDRVSKSPDMAITALLYLPIHHFSDGKEEISDNKGLFFDIGFGLSNPEKFAIQPGSFGKSPKVFNTTTHENLYEISSEAEQNILDSMNNVQSYKVIPSVLKNNSKNNFTDNFVANEMKRRERLLAEQPIYLHQIRISPYVPYNEDLKILPTLGVLYITNNQQMLCDKSRTILIRLSQTIGEIFLNAIVKELLFFSYRIYKDEDKNIKYHYEYDDTFFNLLKFKDSQMHHEAYHRIVLFLHFIFYPSSSFIRLFNTNNSGKYFNEFLGVSIVENVSNIKPVPNLDAVVEEIRLLLTYFSTFSALENDADLILSLKKGVNSVLDFHQAWKIVSDLRNNRKDKKGRTITDEVISLDLKDCSKVVILESRLKEFIFRSKNDLEETYIKLLFNNNYRLHKSEVLELHNTFEPKVCDNFDKKSIKFLTLASLHKMRYIRKPKESIV